MQEPNVSGTTKPPNPESPPENSMDPSLTSEATLNLMSQVFCNTQKAFFPGTKIVPLSHQFRGFYIDDFLNEVPFSGSIAELITDLENLDGNEMELGHCHISSVSDLLSKQTTSITCLRNFITQQIGPWITKIGNLNIELNRLDCFKFKQGDYITCNANKDPEDFVHFYLFLGPEDWHDDDGGMWNLYGECNEQATEVVQTVFPLTNRFILCKSTSTSYVEMSSIKTEYMNGLVVFGTFGLVENIPKPRVQQAKPFPNFQTWINPLYNDESVIMNTRQQFSAQGEVNLVDFLDPDILKEVSQALAQASNTWCPVGPPNMRKYDVLPVDSTNGNASVLNLANFMQSDEMWSFLQNMTGWKGKTNVKDESSRNVSSLDSKVSTCEIRCWKSSYYKMSTDDDFPPLFSARFSFNCDTFPFLFGGNSVSITSLGRERTSTPSENVLHLTLPEQDSYIERVITEDEYEFQDIAVTYFDGKINDDDDHDDESMDEDQMHKFMEECSQSSP